jgi:hypothetical protein
LPERRRCVFFLTSLTLLFASLQAQEFNAGILFGSNTTQFSSTNVDSGNVSSEAGEGWQVALLMEYFENSYFALQTGLRLSQTSAAISQTFSDSLARSDFESLFLYVPIAMRIASRTNPEVYVTVFGAGGVQLSGRVRGQQQLIDLPPAAFEFGGSGGINYQWGKSIFFVEAAYHLGLANYADHEGTMRLYTRQIAFNVGVFWQLSAGSASAYAW